MIDFFREPAAVAGNREHRGRLVVVAQAAKRAQERGQVFARFDGADEQDEFGRQVIARASSDQGFVICHGREERVGRFVNDGDLGFRHAQQPHRVAFSALGYGDDMIRLARGEIDLAVVARAVPRQESRIEEECKIVHGDDTGKAGVGRGNEIRTVQDVERERRQLQRHRQSFKAMVVGSPQFLLPEIRLVDYVGLVFATLENDKFIFTVDLRQGLGQSQYILPNTGLMIVDQTRVDPDAHDIPPFRRSDYTRSRRARQRKAEMIIVCAAQVLVAFQSDW